MCKSVWLKWALDQQGKKDCIWIFVGQVVYQSVCVSESQIDSAVLEKLKRKTDKKHFRYWQACLELDQNTNRHTRSQGSNFSDDKTPGNILDWGSFNLLRPSFPFSTQLLLAILSVEVVDVLERGLHSQLHTDSNVEFWRAREVVKKKLNKL